MLLRYAVELGPKIQAFFEDYFDIPYPLPKQDMIAIPDFPHGKCYYIISSVYTSELNNVYNISGAMENWGLVTYR